MRRDHVPPPRLFLHVHGSDRVSVRFAMRKAAKNYGYFYAFETSKGDYELLRMRLGGEAEVLLTKAHKSKELPCEGLEWSVRTTSVTVSVPRVCFGNPRWVKAGVGVVTFSRAGMYGDDALRPGMADLQAMSPRVRRG